jgi:hypothetical protein
LLWLFWRWGLANYWPRLVSNHGPPNLKLPAAARITNMSHPSHTFYFSSVLFLTVWGLNSWPCICLNLVMSLVFVNLPFVLLFGKLCIMFIPSLFPFGYISSLQSFSTVTPMINEVHIYTSHSPRAIPGV